MSEWIFNRSQEKALAKFSTLEQAKFTLGARNASAATPSEVRLTRTYKEKSSSLAAPGMTGTDAASR
jgi:hypothetical protein